MVCFLFFSNDSLPILKLIELFFYLSFLCFKSELIVEQNKLYSNRSQKRQKQLFYLVQMTINLIDEAHTFKTRTYKIAFLLVLL